MAGRPLAGSSVVLAPSLSSASGSRFAAAAAPLSLLAIWQIACMTGLFPPQVLVPPSEVARCLWLMAGSGELVRHIGDSLYRLCFGFALGALAGLSFGIAIALSRLSEILRLTMVKLRRFASAYWRLLGNSMR